MYSSRDWWKDEVTRQDDGFQESFKHDIEYQLSDSVLYYFQRMDKILDPSYTPNEQDILQSHVKTTEIVETTFTCGKITYQLCDVGGKHSKKTKVASLFVVPLNGYYMTLTEDDTKH